jgi:hypothetical protein
MRKIGRIFRPPGKVHPEGPEEILATGDHMSLGRGRNDRHLLHEWMASTTHQAWGLRLTTLGGPAGTGLIPENYGEGPLLR